jgi:two-component system, OmpR family, sensor kinase
MEITFFNRLYVRIWVAIVIAALVLALGFGWLVRVQAERLRAERMADLPARELIVRDSSGQIIGQATAKPVRVPGQGLEFQLTMPDGKTLSAQLAPRNRPVPGAPAQMGAPPRWLDANIQRNPGALLWLSVIIGLAVALGSYPVMRRLTLRLESLRRSVEDWGAGDLKARAKVQGKDEVAFLAERFNAAANQIETLVQAHKSLLANASHELRSPLARIRMGIELQDSAPSPALRAELARSIGELDALIEEILLASRLDASRHSASLDMGKTETVDVVALAAQECARMGVLLQCESPHVQVQAVPRLLTRVMRNLLENAKRYGGSEVQMQLRQSNALGAGQACVEIEVCDRGPGVPQAEQQRIFEPFYRSTLASERDGGVGLGLALVQSIAKQHGGAVHCHNRTGGGACFTVRLPQSVTG